MGRIEADGEILVDQKEACKLLECSRATFFRRIKAGMLHQIHMADDRTVYVTLNSLMECKNIGPQYQLKKLEPEAVRELKQRHIKLHFPGLTECPGLPATSPDLDPPPSEEE